MTEKKDCPQDQVIFGERYSSRDLNVVTLELPQIVSEEQLLEERHHAFQSRLKNQGVFIDDAYCPREKIGDRPIQQISEEDREKLLAHLNELTE